LKLDNDKRSARKVAAAAAEKKHKDAIAALGVAKKANTAATTVAIGACKAAGYAEA
jgi:hypothetical protein